MKRTGRDHPRVPVESYENLDQLDRDLVALEKNPHDQDRLASVSARFTHQGHLRFFEFTRLGALTHAAENLLSQLRDGKLVLDPEITSALLAWWTRSAGRWPASRRPAARATPATPS